MDGLSPASVDAIARMIELQTDLMWRYLIDRTNLSASAALVINRLAHEGPMRLTALAEAEKSSQSGMTQLVQRMERQGLLARARDPEDGRASLVMLGSAGHHDAQARANLRRQRLAALMRTVPDEDQVALWLAAQVTIRVMGQISGEAARSGRNSPPTHPDNDDAGTFAEVDAAIDVIGEASVMS